MPWYLQQIQHTKILHVSSAFKVNYLFYKNILKGWKNNELQNREVSSTFAQHTKALFARVCKYHGFASRFLIERQITWFKKLEMMLSSRIQKVHQYLHKTQRHFLEACEYHGGNSQLSVKLWRSDRQSLTFTTHFFKWRGTKIINR